MNPLRSLICRAIKKISLSLSSLGEQGVFLYVKSPSVTNGDDYKGQALNISQSAKAPNPGVFLKLSKSNTSLCIRQYSHDRICLPSPLFTSPLCLIHYTVSASAKFLIRNSIQELSFQNLKKASREEVSMATSFFLSQPKLFIKSST